MEPLLTSIGQNLFVLFGLLAVGGAGVLIFSKSAVHSVIGFLFSMICVAGCFLSLEAEFLGVAQLLVYAGGIVVLFLFVVMLVELTKYQEKGIFQTQTKFAVPLVVLGLLAFAGVFRGALFGASATEALTLQPGLASASENLGNAQAVSRGLFANFLLPFEILSVILLVALLGAIVLAKSER
ncbi:MAG: NADH-quinone oxidoreductase subunit J, partial [Acidobacteriota bacterium]|nr:NADH-quinone oxidoreductase subunit J [Acidobacteriota bacterium]